MSGRYKNGETRRIRVLDRALIDEHGERWERVVGEEYCLQPDEVEPYLQRATRLLHLDGRSAPEPVDRARFDEIRRTTDPELVCLHAYTRGADVIVGVDTSDC